MFASKTVERELVAKVLRTAARAPSALNLQPWEITAVMGEELKRLTRRILRAHGERAAACTPGASRPLPEAVQRRRRESFQPMMDILRREGISPERFVGEGSCRFYDAPTAIILCLDQAYSKERYLCLGTFLGYLVLAAHAEGLATCPIGLVASYGEEIKEQLNIAGDREVALGVALGYPDPASPLASLPTPREPLESFVRWIA
jgi:nitroreductase